jgi:methylated-DNA-[protein]-cysteine S-methyltransferase
MPVTETPYVVEGWGVGELWLREGLLLAHEFRFGIGAAEQAERARAALGAKAPPPMGDASPPGATLAAIGRHGGDAFVSRESRTQPPECGATQLVKRVDAFLNGEDVAFDDIELDLDGCTPFERAVTEALRAVPRGAVVTYGELAALAGHPGAQRAAGSFCTRNRFAFIVPCHRVVAADGIGGYGSTGVHIKRRLLELEGAWP